MQSCRDFIPKARGRNQGLITACRVCNAFYICTPYPQVGGYFWKPIAIKLKGQTK